MLLKGGSANLRAGEPVGRSDAINMDRPWTFHLPKGIHWAIVEGLLVTIAVLVGRDVSKASAFAEVNGEGHPRIQPMIWAHL